MEKTSRITVIDGWRAISICMVLAGHVCMHYDKALGLTYPFTKIQLFAKAGVYLFFFISGFVICNSLIAEQQQQGKVSVAGFFIRRLFRIFPPLLLYLLAICIAAYYKLIDFSIPCVLKVPGYFISDVTGNTAFRSCGWYVAHLWSLVIEEQFYIAFPLLFYYIPVKKAPLAFGAIYILLLVVALVSTGTGFFAFGRTALLFSPIALGVAAAFYRQRICKMLQCVPVVFFWLAVVFVLYFYAFPATSMMTARYLLLIFPLSAFIIMYTMARNFPFSAILARNKMLLLIGQASYSMYLWQQLFTGYTRSSLFIYLLLFVLFLTLVCCSFYLVEQPFQRLGRNLSAKIRNRRNSIVIIKA